MGNIGQDILKKSPTRGASVATLIISPVILTKLALSRTIPRDWHSFDVITASKLFIQINALDASWNLARRIQVAGGYWSKTFVTRANLLADPINCIIMRLLAFHQHLNVLLISPDIGATI
jgi:hypothetical protein